MNSKRPTIERIRQPTLFDLQESSGPTDQPSTERPFSLPNILFGTSSFTASGWQGSFYPMGMRTKDFLRHYANQFQTVEIDSTFYGTPAASSVTSWNERTPGDFVFAVKIPQVITHEKVLVDCEPEFDEFIERMHLLGDKLGPMLLQFPKFDKWVLKSANEFRARLELFYRNEDKMMAVGIQTQPEFRAGTSHILFVGQYAHIFWGESDYDVSPDGQRFLMVKGETPPQATGLEVVFNWLDEFNRRVPGR